MLILKKSADDKIDEKFPSMQRVNGFCCHGFKILLSWLTLKMGLPEEIHNSQGYCMLSLLKILLLFRMLLYSPQHRPYIAAAFASALLKHFLEIMAIS